MAQVPSVSAKCADHDQNDELLELTYISICTRLGNSTKRLKKLVEISKKLATKVAVIV